jgi:ATP-dependent Lhr-like helicase
MAGFLRELESDGRVQRIELAKVAEPERWVLTEEAALYGDVFGTESGQGAEEKQKAGETILFRYLETHALVGLENVLTRYPFEARWAKRRLEEWANGGRVVRVETPEALQWSAPENYQQLQRGTLAVLRREVVSCPPTLFADFLLKWQGAYPTEREGGAEGLNGVLHRLQACYLSSELWEEAILPARLADYQPRWLDETLATSEWLWVGRGGEGQGAGAVAFVPRAMAGGMAVSALSGGESAARDAIADDDTQRVLETLGQRGASFVPDLAQETEISPGSVRRALWALVRLGLVTNDSFDAVRRGEDKPAPDAAPEVHAPRRPLGTGTLMHRSTAPRPRVRPLPEGRWSLVPWGVPDVENQALMAARLLLQRYGIVARELALMDERMPPWRILYEVLSRLELAGEVRRGYFVEGLSGAQFALPEAIEHLQQAGVPSQATAPLALLHSLDPANLYGTGAPLDIPLLDGGTRPFFRRSGNWLVLQAGQPVLLIEQHGKKLTALASARQEDVAAAVALLPNTLSKNQRRDIRHKLVVESWNEQPVTATAGKDYLEAVGFVRDYQAMAWYAVWH